MDVDTDGSKEKENGDDLDPALIKMAMERLKHMTTDKELDASNSRDISYGIEADEHDVEDELQRISEDAHIHVFNASSGQLLDRFAGFQALLPDCNCLLTESRSGIKCLCVRPRTAPACSCAPSAIMICSSTH